MDEVLSALGCVPVRECSYAEWLETGMALKDAGYACEVWDEWSRDDPRYVPGDCERRWAGFRGAPRPVTVRSILALARRHGWFSAAADFADDTDATPAGMLARYIETLYQPEETVGFATQVKADSHGRYKPVNTNLSLKAADFIERLEQCGSIEEVIGPYRPECGAWIRMNPLDGKGQADKNVVAFRYVLIESDTLPREEQERFYRKYELPIACLVDSAGKSVHAVVHIDAPGEQEYRKRVNYLFRFLEARGFPVDNANKNPSRLSRMPGAVRGGTMQTLLATNIGRRSWGEWLEYAEELALLPEPVTLSDVKEPPEKPPELIAGVLRRGHKALISGPSKAGKSFLLIELAISIAEGRPWLGFPCRQGKVLYMNLEIDPASCIGRFLAIYRAMGIVDRHDENIVIWNLRGHALPLDRLAPLLIRRMKGEAFSAVIIDPIYKVITGDENNASDMGAFCNLFDKICTEMKAADHLRMPELVSSRVEVCLSAKEQKLYDTLKRELVLKLDSGEVDAANAAALAGKLLQLAGGAVYGEDKQVLRFHERKLDALEDLIEAATGKPLLVAYWYRHDLERIRERFDARPIATARDIADWNAGKIAVGLIHPASAGHGLNLQEGGSTLIWFTPTWSLELYQQTNARLWRQGQRSRTVVIRHIIARGTHDEDVMRALERKDMGQAALIRAVRAQIGGAR